MCRCVRIVPRQKLGRSGDRARVLKAGEASPQPCEKRTKDGCASEPCASAALDHADGEVKSKDDNQDNQMQDAIRGPCRARSVSKFGEARSPEGGENPKCPGLSQF